MQNDKTTSATRLYSMVKKKTSFSPNNKEEDNKNIQSIQTIKEIKEQKDRGEFLKRLIQNEEEDDVNNNNLQYNHNVYSKSKIIYLDNKNDSYQNNNNQESESKKKSNSIITSKENNNNNKESEESEENDIFIREDSKRHKSKKTNSISSKKRNTHTLFIKKKSTNLLLFKKNNNSDKLKNNTVFTRHSINNISNDDKETGKIINNNVNNKNNNNLDNNNVNFINDNNIKKHDKLNINNNLNTLTKNNSIKVSENKNYEKLEQLKIGDIVILINIMTNDLNEINQEKEISFNDGIVYPEIIVSKQLFCLPLSKINDSHRSKSLFKRSLFRIETPQNFFQQNQFEQLKLSYKNNNNDNNALGIKEQTYLKILSRKALEEKNNNESEFLFNYNKKVLFGTIIQLRNIFTNQLLTVDLEYLSKQNSSIEVALNSLGGENSKFIFAPNNSLHNFGEPIYYNDTFHLIPSCLENNHYIHVKNTEDVKGNGYELIISRNQSIFKLLLFESAEFNRKISIQNEIKSTMIVKLYNKEFKGFLSASIYNIDKVLSKLKIKRKDIPLIEEYKSDENSYSMSSNNEENNTKNNKNKNKDRKSIFFDNFILKKNKTDNSSNNSISEESNYNQGTYYNIILDINKEIVDNCLNYWEIQYEKPYEGKIINSECPIRFRHISSGLYLAYDHDKKEITLTQTLNDDSVFYICNENKEKNIKKMPIISEDQIYLRAKNTNLLLKICESKDKNKLYNIALKQENKIKREGFVFKIELQNNQLIQINYNSNLIINHLINLYEQINYWGVKEAEGVDLTKVLIYDYYTALKGELHFKRMVDFYRNILVFIKNESLKAMNDINIFINFQNYHSEQGLIFFLLNFILLFDSKTLENKDEKKGYLEVKEKASPEKIARKHIGDVIELSFSLIKMFIKNNEHSSKDILNYLFLFDELLKNHQLETIEIFIISLKNIFYKNFNLINNLNNSNDYISPSIEDENMRKYDILTSTQYWIKKIKEINEIDNNILAQTKYFKVLKRLCLNAEGGGILKNQMEITKDLYKNNLIPLKFGIDNNNNKPYMVFQLNDIDNDDFFNQNPSLKEIKIENKDKMDIPMFYYSSFTNQYDIFINYICSILDLYYASCVSRNDANKHIMIDNKNVGLTIQHIYLVITDNKINVKIRKRYSRLLRVLFVDSSPRERITNNRMKIFRWNSEINQNDDIFQQIYYWIGKDIINNKKIKGGKNNQGKENDNLNFLRYYINNFYNDKDFYNNLIENSESCEGRIKFYKFLGFLEEILFLTKESLDLGLWNLKDLIILIQNINNFFFAFNYFRKKKNFIKNENELNNYKNNMMGKNNIINAEKKNDIEIKKLIQNSWLAKLVYYCLKSKIPKIKNRLYELYDRILDIYQIISMIKEDSEKYLLMNEYKKWYNGGESLLNNNYMIKLYNSFIKWENSINFGLDNVKNNVKNYEILTDNYIFEILLLDELNYELTEYNLFNKSFSTMINHLNRQENFINELKRLEIIITDEDLKIYESLIKTFTFIKKQKQNIEAIQISKNIPIQIFDVFKKSDKTNLIFDDKINNNKNRDIINLIDDLTNKIDSDLIQKMKLKNNSKLNKIQNFCQILDIHKYLIDLLNFLLNYETKSNIYHKIFQFLYHFCYNNYVNQKLLKRYFNDFLLLMPKYNYIEKVLMEIINLYRENKKSQKFIIRIFQRIKELDLICPEIIKILISIMFNNKKENLSTNQIIILQNFIDILKDNYFRDFLE